MKVTIACSVEQIPAIIAALGANPELSVVVDSRPEPPAVRKQKLRASFRGGVPSFWLPCPGIQAEWRAAFPDLSDRLHELTAALETIYDCSGVPRAWPGAIQGVRASVIENINQLQLQMTC